MGIYDHEKAMTPTDTFGRPTTSVYYLHHLDRLPDAGRAEKPKPKGRAAFSKFHAKDIRKLNLR